MGFKGECGSGWRGVVMALLVVRRPLTELRVRRNANR